VIEETVDADGEEYTVPKVNPAITAENKLSGRQREIAKELKLWPGFQD